MIKFYKISEIIYLFFAIISIIIAIFRFIVIKSDYQIPMALSVIAFFMYVLRKKFRKKLEKRKGLK